MKVKIMLMATSVIFTATVSLHASEILNVSVPWSGRMRKVSLDHIVARVTGWADVGNSGGLVLTEPIPSELARKQIERFHISPNPAPTYGEVLVAAFGATGQRVILAESDKGVKVTYLYERIFSISSRDGAQWAKKNKFNTEAIMDELLVKGWKLSAHCITALRRESMTLHVSGTQMDIDAAERFLSAK